jgi:hypothetical protein
MNQAIQERLAAIEDQLWEQAQKNVEEAQELEFDERVEREYERLRDKAEQAIEDELAEEAADNEEE